MYQIGLVCHLIVGQLCALPHMRVGNTSVVSNYYRLCYGEITIMRFPSRPSIVIGKTVQNDCKQAQSMSTR